MKTRLSSITVFAVLTIYAGHSHAGGLFLPGLGTQAMGRGGAFTAKADDPTALYHNPAGLAKTSGTVIYLGSNLIDFSLSFQRTGSYEASTHEDLDYAGDPFPLVENQADPGIGFAGMQAIPLLAVATDLGNAVPGLRLGFGVYAPNAYPARDFGDYDFANEAGAPPPQRYDMVKLDALAVNPSLAASYSINDMIDVGARFSWGVATLEATSYTWAVPNYEEYIGADGRFDVKVSDSFVPEFALGVLVRPLSSLEIGASYSNGQVIEGVGEGQAALGSYAQDPLGGGTMDRIIPINDTPICAAGGTPEALKTCVEFKLPRTATLGARWIIRDGAGGERADIELDVKWENWSKASDMEVIVDGRSEATFIPLNPTYLRHGFQDVLSVRLGGAYNLPLGKNKLGIRGGVAHDTATAPNSWQRVDLDGAARTTLALGASFQAARFSIDLAGGVVLEGDRSAEYCNPANGAEGCSPDGSVAVDERTAPDPAQPLLRPEQAGQSPFNGGDYSSGYMMLSLGLSTRF